MTLIYENIDVAFGLESLGEMLLQILDIPRYIAFFFARELVDERANEPRRGGIELADQILSALGAANVFVNVSEHILNLLIQFDAVGDDKNTRVLDILTNPSGEPNHCETLAATLCVPNNAAFAFANAFLRGADDKVLIRATDFFGPCIEDDKVVDDFEKPFLVAELEQRAV